MRRVAVTGYGVVTANARNASEFEAALRSGKSGLSLVEPAGSLGPVRIAGQIKNLDVDNLLVGPDYLPERFPAANLKKLLRNAPLGLKLSLLTVLEAHRSAKISGSGYLESEKGLIIGGSNLHQNLIYQDAQKFLKTPEYLNPLHSLVFFDTHQIGLISEVLDIKGLGFTVGGASASGNMCVLQAFRAVRHGDVPVCYAVGAMADFSPVEFQGFATLGALYTGESENDPAHASRPFDEKHCGFVFGQGSACLVLEDYERAEKRGAPIHAEILAAEMALDATHLTDPSVEGETRVMKTVLAKAGIRAADVNYLNAHGTASPLGDKTELAAIDAVFGSENPGLLVNATKSLTGHCLTSAGTVELVATLLQMKG
ncbi:MAG: polyketide beta-ketoacyl:ACP synthase, partial [Spirochaetia bacterium]|nr:polyketide beta-ketoacyl:ACP synthase [Spirochaetia bacterium]